MCGLMISLWSYLETEFPKLIRDWNPFFTKLWCHKVTWVYSCYMLIKNICYLNFLFKFASPSIFFPLLRLRHLTFFRLINCWNHPALPLSASSWTAFNAFILLRAVVLAKFILTLLPFFLWSTITVYESFSVLAQGDFLNLNPNVPRLKFLCFFSNFSIRVSLSSASFD